ncbi:rhombosortase [Shewanella sp. AS1]|uniref:rhombosortase n=1 Tax=Shewanella sp. AS1 TaxID=2907626 RepID=UPI001F1DFE34|nr:rhombosortase [Shewanella sp. AS1]MCE9678546.1 rhombosortase [Shewanella sp. AS1]
MIHKLKSTATPYSVVAFISLLCVTLFIIQLEGQLGYRRSAISHGEWWRLFSGNLLHTNALHLLMNLAGLWVISFLHENHYRLANFSLIFILLGLLQGIGLYLFFPALGAYVGLSGLLHGLFTYGALRDIQSGIRSGYLLLVGVCAKVLYEQVYGASEQITQMINARVATEAHLVGVISGILLFILFRLVRRLTH